MKLNRTVSLAAVVSILSLAGQDEALGVDSFYLRNTNSRTSIFHFFSEESHSWQAPALQLISDERALVNLQSKGLHFLRYFTLDGVRYDLGRFDFHKILAGRQGTEISLEMLAVSETRMMTAPVTRMVLQQRTRYVQIIQLVPEVRTRMIVVINSSGQRVRRVENYTVTVPVVRLVEQVYMVQVPVTQLEERTQTVVVERPRLVIRTADGRAEVLEAISSQPERKAE